jgi:SM-20-related protein
MLWLESLLDSLTFSGVSFSDQALTESQRIHWLRAFNHHRDLGLFKPSAIGRNSTLQKNLAIRNDETSWLDCSREEDSKILNELDQWRLFLSESLLMSMRTTEAHFANYQAGHYYRRHKDQHDSKTSRILTFVVYLHSSWKAGDGGELVVTDGDSERDLQIIEPLPGRVVLFKSDEIWHEVRKSNFERSSLTGWFRHDTVAI